MRSRCRRLSLGEVPSAVKGARNRHERRGSNFQTHVAVRLMCCRIGRSLLKNRFGDGMETREATFLSTTDCEMVCGLCCKSSQRSAMDRKIPFLLSLGAHAKQAGNEGHWPQ